MSSLIKFWRFGIVFFLLVSKTTFATDLSYTVIFEGVRSPMRQKLEKSSSLVAWSDHPPSTLAALRRRTNNDLPQLVRLMHNEGYYDASIEPFIEFVEGLERYNVHIKVTKGPRYAFAEPVISLCHDEFCSAVVQSIENIDLLSFGLGKGEPATANAIIESRGQLIYRLGEEGFALPELKEEVVLVNRRNKTVTVSYNIDPGEVSFIGQITILGLERVMESFVLDHIQWCQGDRFHPQLLAQLESDLQSSALFSFARVSTGNKIDQNGEIPIIIKVVEAKHRSIGAGVSYGTSQGFGFSGEWEHRNFYGRGEKLSLKGIWLSRMQQGMLAYRVPNFLRCHQTLLWLMEYRGKDTEGFQERSGTASLLLENQISTCQTLSYGIALKQIDSEGSDDQGSYTLFKLPLYYEWNSTNDILDPTIGTKVILHFVPTQDLNDKNLQYTFGSITGIWYYPFDTDRCYVLASKIVVESLAGAERVQVPAPERIYSGNEHTLRGYKYLTVSPIGSNGKPIGGRSMVAGSFEWRQRFTESWGGSVFYEVGNVFADPVPSLDRKMLQSVGAGIRYFTSIGPIRLDLAIPLNRRKGIDPSVQVYFSIGQAF